MSYLDWDVYSKEIFNRVDSCKNEFLDVVAGEVRDFIGHQIYWSLEQMIPLIDFEQDDFTLRLSWDCCVDKKDTRNILFSLKEELSEYDGGNFERLDRLKIIFQNCISLVEARAIELERQWGRD